LSGVLVELSATHSWPNYEMNGDGPLVSVIVPAYNAAATIERTLDSIVHQTYTNIEVLVVDDGSSDETCKIALRFVKTDPRIRLIRKANGGVASARNAGIESASGEFLAPIDADDLWHPSRVARHVAALVCAPADVGLVYSPFRRIDNDDRVFRSSHTFRVSGWVFFRHLYVNLVGNGSGITVRRHIVTEASAYQSWLREVGAEGCEDFLLQLTIAMNYRFIVVPEFLVGYRDVAARMSSDKIRMMRSQLLVIDAVTKRCTELPTIAFRVVRLKHLTTLLIELLRGRRYRELLRELDIIRIKDPWVLMLVAIFALALLGRACRWSFVRVWRGVMGSREAAPQPFLEFKTDERPGPRLAPTMTFWLAVLGLFDHFCADLKGYFPRLRNTSDDAIS
jgi:glycosyltransferase involved in cell wall biosynthesis